VRVRFLADADLNKAILSGVLRREPSLEFLTAQAAGLRGLSDSAVLTIAAEGGWSLVSHDVGTLPKHFRAFWGQQRQAEPRSIPSSADSRYRDGN